MTRSTKGGQATRALVVLVALGLPSCSEVAEWRAMRAAEAAMRPWLALVDAGRYQEAWEQSSPELRARSGVAEWTGKIRGKRPGGAVAHRSVASRRYFKRFTNGVEGPFVNLAYQVELSDGSRFGELLTANGRTGTWLVYGYLVVGVHAGGAVEQGDEADEAQGGTRTAS